MASESGMFPEIVERGSVPSVGRCVSVSVSVSVSVCVSVCLHVFSTVKNMWAIQFMSDRIMMANTLVTSLPQHGNLFVVVHRSQPACVVCFVFHPVFGG